MIGLSLIPLGLLLRARQLGGYRAAIESSRWDAGRVGRLAGVILAATLVNIALMSAATYEGLEYLDSDEFCGTVCHAVMTPHYEAHKESPHAEVACVQCHVGPGPGSFIQAKVSGTTRLLGVTFDSYQRPTRITDANRAPVAAACDNCHWRGQTQGDQLRLIRHYSDDEKNTPTITLLLMRIDSAIHRAHVGRNILYIPEDNTRRVIPWVSLEGREYVSGDVPDALPQKMDCLDCHNRAAHRFELPEQALDRVMAEGRIDVSTPFAKRDALRAIDSGGDFPSGSDVIAEIREANVFPELDITWGTYADNIGHEAYPGCFRCHDYLHQTEAGETIDQDCFACHEMLAIEEQDPEIVRQLGLGP